MIWFIRGRYIIVVHVVIPDDIFREERVLRLEPGQSDVIVQNTGNTQVPGQQSSLFRIQSVANLDPSVAGPDPGSRAFLPLDPGSWTGKKSRSGSNFRMLRYIFWVKLHKFFDADPDPESRIFLTLMDPGWKKFGYDQHCWIRILLPHLDPDPHSHCKG